MTDDPRCCGTGTCLINADGLCWCGQQWDGEAMGFASLQKTDVAAVGTSVGPPEIETAARKAASAMGLSDSDGTDLPMQPANSAGVKTGWLNP